MTLLQMTGVARQFGRRTVLEDIDLDVAAEERVALRGPNGSGKTTLLRIAAGTLPASSGTILRDPSIGYLPQDVPVYRELSVADHLRFVAKVHQVPWDDAHTVSALADSGLARLADRPAGTLSRGQRQRLGLTMATMTEPDLLLLDEPWTALDADGASWLDTRLHDLSCAVVAAVHDPSPFTADRTITLHGGRIR